MRWSNGLALALLGALVWCGGCRTEKKVAPPGAELITPEKNAPKTEPAKKKAGQGFSLFKRQPSRAPSMLDSQLNGKELDALRAMEKEDVDRSDRPRLGPGVYDKDSKARKDWVF